MNRTSSERKASKPGIARGVWPILEQTTLSHVLSEQCLELIIVDLAAAIRILQEAQGRKEPNKPN